MMKGDFLFLILASTVLAVLLLFRKSAEPDAPVAMMPVFGIAIFRPIPAYLPKTVDPSNNKGTLSDEGYDYASNNNS